MLLNNKTYRIYQFECYWYGNDVCYIINMCTLLQISLLSFSI